MLAQRFPLSWSSSNYHGRKFDPQQVACCLRCSHIFHSLKFMRFYLFLKCVLPAGTFVQLHAVPMDARGEHQLLWNWVTDSSEPPCIHLGPNPGPSARAPHHWAIFLDLIFHFLNAHFKSIWRTGKAGRLEPHWVESLCIQNEMYTWNS